MSRRSRLGTVPLLARTVAPQASVTLLVALLTLVAALIAAGVPRALDTLDEADLSHSLDSISQPQRDVGGGIVPFLVGPAPDKEVAKLPDPAFGRVQSALAAARATVPAALRSALGAPQIVASTHAQPASLAPAPATPAAWNDAVALIADPAYSSRIALVSGALPQAWTVPDTTIATGFGDEPAPDPASAAPIDMVVTTGTATTMGLHVGDVLSTAFSQTEVRVRISGIVRALDPSADFWQNTPGVLAPGRVYDGNASPDLTYTATGFVAPGTVLPLSGFAVLNGAFWFPVNGAQVTAAHARAVVDAVHGLQATQIPIADTIAGDQTGTVRVPVQTGLADAVEQSLGRVSALLAILAVLVSGPLGVVVAVFALAVRAVLERRGAVLSLAAARGASPLQLRSVAAVEGLLAGVPAAVVGALVAAIVLPGPDAAAWVVPTLIGLVPAALFASFGAGRGFRTRRRDLSARARGSARWIVEACVLGGAAVTTWLLLRRGPIADSGFDALLALTPLLLALAVAVVVLRLLPIALRAALAVGRRGRGPVAFLGAARAMRDPALGVAAALAVVVGVSVSVLSSGVLASIGTATQRQAVTQVGADVSAAETAFSPAALHAVRAAPGVTRVAEIAQTNRKQLGINGITSTVLPFVADTAALHAVRPDIPGDLARKVDGRVPILVSADVLGDHLHVGDRVDLNDLPVVIVGQLPSESQLGADSAWALADQAYAAVLSPSAPLTPTQLLIALRPGASPAAVERAIRATAPGAVVADAASLVAATDAAPAAAALRRALLIAAIGSALLAALAVFAGSVSAAGSRNSAIAMLRTMGLTGSQALGLVVWEIVPLVVASAAVGLALGLALPHLLVATTDLAPFTGGATRLAVTTDWPQLALLVAGVLAVAAVATLVAVLVARRTDPAGTVKMGAE